MKIRTFACSWRTMLVLTVVSTAAQAGTVNWVGGFSYDSWTDPRNWAGGTLPTTGDTAIIASGTASISGDLAPAPDLIRVDSLAKCTFSGATITNDFVLNGGIFDMTGDNNPTVSGGILLTADSIIQNTRGNSNRRWNISGPISEDASPRALTLRGNSSDNTYIGGTNTYTGGTTVTGSGYSLTGVSALGAGPVDVQGGRLAFVAAGDYTHGVVTVTGGSIIVGNSGIANEVWNFRAGNLAYDHQPRTLDATNQVTITNTVGILAGGGYYNNAFTIATSISGTGKAVLNNGGSTSSSQLRFTAAQQWTGGTDVKGIVSIATGGSLPAGTVTVYPVSDQLRQRRAPTRSGVISRQGNGPRPSPRFGQ